MNTPLKLAGFGLGLAAAFGAALGIGTVVGMTCGHCVSAVTEEVSQVPGVTGVDVDLASGGLTVTSDAPVGENAVRAAIEEAGYAVAGR